MPFLRNHWYVAAVTEDLSQGLVSRKILGEQVTLFRNGEGKPIAVSDICPHRFAPLHKGKVVDGTIECPYHGLRFGSDGRCVANPDGGHIPRGARLKSYPVIERWNCVWIWPGDPARADPNLMTDYPFLDAPGQYARVAGYLKVNANYILCIDNVMDLAHLRTVHSDTLYTPKVSDANTILKRDADGTIWANRVVEASVGPPNLEMLWQAMRGTSGDLKDLWFDVKWNAPALVQDVVGLTAHGGKREEGFEIKATHFFTPETETTTHYFWAITRDFDIDHPEIDEQIRVATEYAFIHEDEVMLHAVQEAMGTQDFWEMRPALIPADVGSVEARRALERMIAAEQKETMPA
jgi:phenylpropionate dioxygenase-like ring-hydroxylating dioxygenase large terminal subunit